MHREVEDTDIDCGEPPSAGRPRVLILSTSQWAGRGGRETAVREVLRQLHASGRIAALAMMDHANDAQFEQSILSVGVQLYIAGIPPHGAVTHHFIRTLAFVRQVLFRVRPDAVLVTEPASAFLMRASTLTLRRARPITLSWLHTDPRLVRHAWALSACDGHLAICEGIADCLPCAAYGKPTFVVYNPVDTDAVTPCVRPDAHDPFQIWFIGRLHEHKGVDRILEALSKAGTFNWTLNIVGAGPEGPRLRRLAERWGMADRIRWYGWLDDPWAAVQSASILVLTSWVEGFPMVLVEALARGVPILAMDCDFGPREVIITGRNGWLIPNGDVSAMAEILRDLGRGDLRLPAPDDVRASAQRFSSIAVVSRIVNAIERIAEARLK